MRLARNTRAPCPLAKRTAPPIKTREKPPSHLGKGQILSKIPTTAISYDQLTQAVGSLDYPRHSEGEGLNERALAVQDGDGESMKPLVSRKPPGRKRRNA